jgi:hypothetical protein
MIADFLEYRRIAAALAEKALDRFIPWGEKQYRKKLAEHKNQDLTNFSEYLRRKGIVAGNVRNILYYSRSVPLYDIYVSTDLAATADRSIAGDTVIRSLAVTREGKAERPTNAIAISRHGGNG